MNEEQQTIVVSLPESVKSEGQIGFNYSTWLRFWAKIIDNSAYSIAFWGTLLVFVLSNKFVDNLIVKNFVGILALVFLIGIFFCFYAIQVAIWGQTLGQKIVGLEYRTINNNKVTFGRMVLRRLSYLIPFGDVISLFMVSGSPTRVSLYDSVCSTRVIRTAKPKNMTAVIILAVVLLNVVWLTMVFSFSQYMPKSERRTYLESKNNNSQISTLPITNNKDHYTLDIKKDKNGEYHDGLVIVSGELTKDRIISISQEIILQGRYNIVVFYSEDDTTTTKVDSVFDLTDGNQQLGVLINAAKEEPIFSKSTKDLKDIIYIPKPDPKLKKSVSFN
jgi:uncharacterized RDD family membrane protein YckC